MSKMKPHILEHDIPTTVAWVHPASKKSIKKVLCADENSVDGRSNWVWVRLANGDLILGVFPQGETYFAVEKDAQFPNRKMS